MQDRKKAPREMVSACDILREMLKHPPVLRALQIGGYASVSIKTFDEDTNALLRAQFACKNKMVVSPLSRDRLFYTDPDNFQAEAEQAEAATKDKCWLPKFGKG